MRFDTTLAVAVTMASACAGQSAAPTSPDYPSYMAAPQQAPPDSAQRAACPEPREAAAQRVAADKDGAAENMGSVEARDLGDLDGDGRSEFAVQHVYKVAVTTTIYGRDASGCARAVLKDGSGIVSRVLETRTDGWKDLELAVVLNPMMGATNACNVTLRASYKVDGYLASAVVQVTHALSEGGNADLAECRSQAQSLIGQ